MYSFFLFQQPMVMICSLTDPTALAGTIKTIQVVNHPSEEQGRHSTGLNIAKWVPTLGAGFVYGTDKGDLRICRPRYDLRKLTCFRIFFLTFLGKH